MSVSTEDADPDTPESAQQLCCLLPLSLPPTFLLTQNLPLQHPQLRLVHGIEATGTGTPHMDKLILVFRTRCINF